MAAKNRRINVTLPPELDRVVEGLSVAMQTPMSKIILSFMLDALPVLEMTLAAVQEAQSGKKGVALEMAKTMLGDAGVLLEGGQRSIFEEEKAEKVRKRARARKRRTITRK